MAIDRIRGLLEDAFPSSDVHVDDRTGGGDHFQVSIRSSRFDGMSRIDQHRLVNQTLEALLQDGTIHELRIKTRGTDEHDS